MKPKNEKALNIYGRVPTSLLRDARVSLKAKALYAYIDDKPDDWHFSSARIARETKDGINAIRKGIVELKNYGYLEIKRENDEQGYRRQYFKLFAPEITQNPEEENRDEENREEENLPPNTDILVTQTESNTDREHTNSAKKNSLLSQFDQFYLAYPKKLNREAAKRAFLKAYGKSSPPSSAPPPPPFAELMEILENHKSQWNDPQFIPYPASWLNKARWQDDLGSVDRGKRVGIVE